jgi:kynureninase
MGGTEWLGYRYIPANPLAPGYRYFAIRLKKLEVPEGNGWLVQLGSVKIEFE